MPLNQRLTSCQTYELCSLPSQSTIKLYINAPQYKAFIFMQVSHQSVDKLLLDATAYLFFLGFKGIFYS
jgi:hypothetical protein